MAAGIGAATGAVAGAVGLGVGSAVAAGAGAALAVGAGAVAIEGEKQVLARVSHGVAVILEWLPQGVVRDGMNTDEP